MLDITYYSTHCMRKYKYEYVVYDKIRYIHMWYMEMYKHKTSISIRKILPNCKTYT